MAEPITATTNLLQQLITLIPEQGRNFVQWLEAHDDAPTKLRELDQTLQSVKDLFESIHSELGRFGHGRASDLQTSLTSIEQSNAKLMEDAKKKRHKVYPSVLDNKIKDLLQSLEGLKKKILDLLPDTSDASGDRYITVRNVERNPDDIVIDFVSKDESERPITSEGQLAHAIFNQDNRAVGAVVGAVAQRLGGVGKSCALRAIGWLQQSQEQFPGGILYIVLGADKGLRNLIESIAGIVERAGGAQKEVDVKHQTSLSTAACIAGEWFEHRPCLFLIDDIWCVNGITPESLVHLSNLARHEESRIAYTTRDTAVKWGTTVVFEESLSRGGKARSVLSECAKLRPPPKGSDAEKAFEYILDRIGGLAIALSVSGRAVRHFAEGRCSTTPERAWVMYSQRLKHRPVLSGEEEMKRSVLLSLELLDECWRERGISEVTSRERFTALNVLREQQQVPTAVASRLWNTSESETDHIIDGLERFSIARVLTGTGGEPTIGLHDVILEISRAVAQEDGTALQWSKTLIESYCPGDLASAQSGSLENFEDWWARAEDDGYIFRNVFWLLRQGDWLKHMLGLVCDPSWIVKQLRSNGDAQVAEDVRLAIECVRECSTSMSASERNGMTDFLKVLCESAHMRLQGIGGLEWDGLLWFQLYGRMVHLAGMNPHVGNFTKRIEDAAPRPWLKPSVGCIEPAGGSLRHIIEVEGRVLSSIEVGGAVHIVYKYNDSVFLKRYDSESRTTSEPELVLRVTNFSHVECAQVSGDNVMVGVANRTVWCGRRGTTEDTDEGMTADRERAEIRNRRTQDTFTRKRSAIRKVCKCFFSEHKEEWAVDGEGWMSAVLKGYKSSVRSVALSADRGRLVSGSDDGTVRVWERDGERWVDTVLHGHELSVESVALSADRSRVVSGSHDQTVRVWESDGGRWVDTVLHGHEDLVRSVALSAGGSRVVSGSHDQTVRVWERDGGRWVDTVLHGHEDLVRSVALSADGSRLVSGSYDRTVRVWERDVGRWGETVLEEDSIFADGVAISEDGQVVEAQHKWKWEGRNWSKMEEVSARQRHLNLFQDFGWDERLDDGAVSLVYRLGNGRAWMTATGYFVKLTRRPYLAQIEAVL